MATDYDAPHTEVKVSHEESMEAVKSANRPDPRSVVLELDGDESGEHRRGVHRPAGPAGADEFVCQSCFLVRHRSQKAREKNGLACCSDCEG